MTEELVRLWLDSGNKEIQESAESPAVQTPEEIEKNLPDRLGRLHEVAGRLYDRWTEGLGR
jgi:hypothetical protein